MTVVNFEIVALISRHPELFDYTLPVNFEVCSVIGPTTSV